MIYLIFCAVLFVAGSLANANDIKMLLLTLAVGSGIFFPIPNQNFYAWCIVVEILVCCIAVGLSAMASRVIVCMSVTLIGFHFLGASMGGHLDDSPYHTLVKVCELLELAACILLSRPFVNLFIKDAKQCLK